MQLIDVTRSDLQFIYRSIDNAHSELEGPVHEGDVAESVTEDMREAMNIIEQYLNDNRD